MNTAKNPSPSVLFNQTFFRKALGLDPNLPIIAMSGLASEELQGEAMKRGARVFLRKPFGAEELLTVLTQALRSGPG